MFCRKALSASGTSVSWRIGSAPTRWACAGSCWLSVRPGFWLLPSRRPAGTVRVVARACNPVRSSPQQSLLAGIRQSIPLNATPVHPCPHGVLPARLRGRVPQYGRRCFQQYFGTPSGMRSDPETSMRSKRAPDISDNSASIPAYLPRCFSIAASAAPTSGFLLVSLSKMTRYQLDRCALPLSPRVISDQG